MNKKPEWVLIRLYGDIAATTRWMYEHHQWMLQMGSKKRASSLTLLAEGLTEKQAKQMRDLTKETT